MRRSKLAERSTGKRRSCGRLSPPTTTLLMWVASLSQLTVSPTKDRQVYALGLVFWELLEWPFKHKTYPFQGLNEHAIFEEVGRKGHRPNTVPIRRKWGREIVSLVERMWHADSRRRPTMPDVVKTLRLAVLQLPLNGLPLTRSLSTARWSSKCAKRRGLRRLPLDA